MFDLGLNKKRKNAKNQLKSRTKLCSVGGAGVMFTDMNEAFISWLFRQKVVLVAKYVIMINIAILLYVHFSGK